jgi:hypothetical protein
MEEKEHEFIRVNEMKDLEYEKLHNFERVFNRHSRL